MNSVYDKNKNELFIKDSTSIIIIATIKNNREIIILDGGTFDDNPTTTFDGGSF
jgi:hypothetical protein